jgi:large subunit ribosomal protein L5
MVFMQHVILDKVVVNMGVGAEPDEMKKGLQIMQLITGKKPCKTITQSRIPDWGIRPGSEVGIKVTLREEDALAFLKKAFLAKENKLPEKSIDRTGNFGFGVREYIDLPDAKYDPKLGIKGFDVLVSLRKKGYRVKLRKIMTTKVGKKQRVTKEDTVEFVKSLGVQLE